MGVCVLRERERERERERDRERDLESHLFPQSAKEVKSRLQERVRLSKNRNRSNVLKTKDSYIYHLLYAVHD